MRQLKDLGYSVAAVWLDCKDLQASSRLRLYIIAYSAAAGGKQSLRECVKRIRLILSAFREMEPARILGDVITKAELRKTREQQLAFDKDSLMIV